jgi:hypothetical protein
MAIAVVQRPPAMTAEQYKESWSGGAPEILPVHHFPDRARPLCDAVDRRAGPRRQRMGASAEMKWVAGACNQRYWLSRPAAG